jgi:hypothetical protein
MAATAIAVIRHRRALRRGGVIASLHFLWPGTLMRRATANDDYSTMRPAAA